MTNNSNQDNKLVFRLQDENTRDLGLKKGEHWFEPKDGDGIGYDDTQIRAIPSENEASEDEPTSIPSPFARLALAKTAFAAVGDEKNFKRIIDSKKDTSKPVLAAYQKIVSDCLDVAQIFFNYNTLQDKVEIITWNKKSDLEEMKARDNQKELGKTLDIFLKNQGDIRDYHFDKIENIYLLRYTCIEGGAGDFDIIGATSPATLFFSSGNKFPNVSRHIKFDNHNVFGEKPVHLYQRDLQFFAYLKQLCKEVHDAFKGDILDELREYIKQNEAQLSPAQKKQLAQTVALKSITNTKEGKTHIYATTNEKGERTAAFEFRQKETSFQVSDFFEKKIIKLPYKMADGFFNGNLSTASADDRSSYLLPLTDNFFKHHSVEDLKYKDMISIFVSGSVVEVTLKIPGAVAGTYTEHKKQYGSADTVESSLDFALFPNIKFQNDVDAYYRFGLISEFDKTAKYTLSYYGNDNKKEDCPPILRNETKSVNKQLRHYNLDSKNFNYLQISCNDARGLIIPTFGQANANSNKVTNNGKKTITFAVDFGTTNTHIEYMIDNQPPATAFNISSVDKQIYLLSGKDERENEYKWIFDADFLPEKMGKEEEYGFPTRTVLSEKEGVEWNSPVFAMVHANIPFGYEKRSMYEYNKITPNLKWSNIKEEHNKKRIAAYIETLFLILRNKVILSDGDLKKTKIVWFYPISMTEDRFGSFNKIWKDAYEKYFGGKADNVISMTESVAPYKFYKDVFNKASNIITIDIGGGTTDIAIAEKRELKYITSFRFAANAIFGDGYGTNPLGSTQNGIVRQLKGKMRNILKVNNMDELVSIFDSRDKGNDSVEIASFLFSLSNNKELIGKNIAKNVDFGDLIREEGGSQKIIFVLFYTAIIYHIAQILKAKGLTMPDHITFSGNGSKVIRILSTETATLEKFTKIIFGKILTVKDSDELKIVHSAETPKEATCKGGLSSSETEDYDSIDSKRVILKGAPPEKKEDSNPFFSGETYASLKDEELIAETAETAKAFLNFVLDLNKEFSFSNKFSVDAASISLLEKEAQKNLESFVRDGLKSKRKEVSDDKIEETFFFYPLVGLLYELSGTICDAK